MNWNDAYSKKEQPTIYQIEEFVNNKLWEKMDRFLQQNYNTSRKIEHSSCSWQPGWNVKYKKSGKSLCVLYPMSGYFIILVTIREAELDEAEALVSMCNTYTQNVFANAKVTNGQKGIMFEIKDEETLKAVTSLIELRATALGFVKFSK